VVGRCTSGTLLTPVAVVLAGPDGPDPVDAAGGDWEPFRLVLAT